MVCSPIGPPDDILEVAGEGKIQDLDAILEVGKMSLDVLDSDIKASSPENIHYRHSNFIEVILCHYHFSGSASNIFRILFLSELVRGVPINKMEATIQMCSSKIGKILGKYLWKSLFLVKLQAVRPTTLQKMNSITGIFQEFC